MRATHRAPAEPRPRRRRYRIHPGWAGVATSIVSELADLLLPPMPEEPFAFFEADDSVRRYRGDGSLRIDTAAGAWCDDRTGEAGGIFGLLAKLLRSRQAAREWVRCDHKEEWKRPWPPRRGPTFQRRPSDREHAEVPLSAVLGRESVTPPPPPRTDPKASCGPRRATRRSSGARAGTGTKARPRCPTQIPDQAGDQLTNSSSSSSEGTRSYAIFSPV